MRVTYDANGADDADDDAANDAKVGPLPRLPVDYNAVNSQRLLLNIKAPRAPRLMNTPLKPDLHQRGSLICRPWFRPDLKSTKNQDNSSRTRLMVIVRGNYRR